jgi:hypothetical protein
MALQAIVEDLDAVPEALREYYREIDDGFVLDLEGVERHPATRALKNAKDREAEERRKRGEKVVELEDRLKAFEGLDAEAARRALAEAEAQADRHLIDQGEIDTLIQGKTARLRTEHEIEIKSLGAALSEAKAALAEVKIFDAIKDAAIKAGVRDGALDDVVNRARAVWRLVDGAPAAVRPDTGDEPWLADDGAPITMGRWVDDLAGAAAHLFKPNRGGDAQGGGVDATGRQVIDIAEPNAIGRNLEAFAKGEVTGTA